MRIYFGLAAVVALLAVTFVTVPRCEPGSPPPFTLGTTFKLAGC